MISSQAKRGSGVKVEEGDQKCGRHNIGLPWCQRTSAGQYVGDESDSTDVRYRRGVTQGRGLTGQGKGIFRYGLGGSTFGGEKRPKGRTPGTGHGVKHKG